LYLIERSTEPEKSKYATDELWRIPPPLIVLTSENNV
jgi:hypothetical protein